MGTLGVHARKRWVLQASALRRTAVGPQRGRAAPAFRQHVRDEGASAETGVRVRGRDIGHCSPLVIRS